MLQQFFKPNIIEAGCDEAGRGCLAGPVLAAAVVLPSDFFNEDLNDSKKLSPSKRERLREVIIRESIDYKVEYVTEKEIDTINILNASILCMHKALDGLNVRVGHIIVDGNRFKVWRDRNGVLVPHNCIVKGDATFASIAAASVLAKTFRDDYMRKAALDYPEYGWDKNFGYPTKSHRMAIKKYGVTPLHRTSFTLLPDPELF